MRTLPLLLALALLAGCFGDEAAPNERSFRASGGIVTAGWAYDGLGIVGREAELSGNTVNDANTGVIHVTMLVDDEPWVVHFDRFAQAEGRDFQDGGVAHALDEHGDTGVADTSIPRIHAIVAAWGTATVTRSGVPVTSEPWAAHLMVSRDTVRIDGKITKADGVTPYDPNAPGDARRVEGDLQAFLTLRHPQGDSFARPPATSYLNLSCAAPQCVASGELAVETGATALVLNATGRPDGQLPLAAGRSVSIVFSDAMGVQLAVLELGDVVAGPVPPPTATTAVTLGADFVGPISARVSGDGVFGVSLEATATYNDRPFLVITWDEPTVS